MRNPWIYATKSGTQKTQSLPKEVRGSGGSRSLPRCCWGRFVRLHGDPWYVPGSLPAAPASPSAAHVCEGEGRRGLLCNVFGGIRVGGTCPATVRIPSHNMITCRGVWGSGRPVFRGAGGPIHSPFTCGSGTWEASRGQAGGKATATVVLLFLTTQSLSPMTATTSRPQRRQAMAEFLTSRCLNPT